MVSVIICCYNGADRVSTALESAVGQSLPSDQHEVLFIDDGSTDGTAEIIQPYLRDNPNLRYLRQETNQGLTWASNVGVREARGRYIIRLDHDDRFAPDILESMVPPLEEGKTDLAYSDRYEVTSEKPMRYVSLEKFDLFSLLAAGTMMRRDMVIELGCYRPVFWEEYDLYLRYLERSRRPPVHIPRPLYYYSQHTSSMTADPDSVRKGWQELKDIWGETALRRAGWNGDETHLLGGT